MELQFTRNRHARDRVRPGLRASVALWSAKAKNHSHRYTEQVLAVVGVVRQLTVAVVHLPGANCEPVAEFYVQSAAHQDSQIRCRAGKGAGMIRKLAIEAMH